MSNDDMDLMNLWFQDVEGKTRITAICQPITNTEARRKFEEAYQAAIDRGFVSTKRLCWQIWQAALDSVVVELPEKWVIGHMNNKFYLKEEMDAALAAAGVRTNE